MRRATIRTELEDADVIAASVAPDNTSEIETNVEGGAVVTTIERGTTGGLQSTVDDYVVNLSVAEQVVRTAKTTPTTQTAQTTNDDTNTNHE
ncbi:KEOPS complex subunit Pcc1 [Haladaptatus salinisoli]|uniref:KEOPS complex subunit Pcc1 n=1 Tax=Haladaptatus salinisoli TaxID=2884876 RepID=UPI001D0B6ED3|nr:KEOPS complex subunit Pcc1 [Haladaptatus salinisoli]